MPKGLQGFQKGHKDLVPKESRKRAAFKISKALTGIKRSDETKAKFSEARKGKPTWWMKRGLSNPMQGKKTSENVNHKKAMAMLRGKNNPAYKNGFAKCIDCGKTLNHYFTGISCRVCSGLKRRAENHHNWRGGITPFYKQVRECTKYKNWLNSCLVRDDYTCQECGIKGGDLAVDHIKQFALIVLENNIQTLEDAESCIELWNTDNGRTLCINCHKLTNTYGAKVKLYAVS